MKKKGAGNQTQSSYERLVVKLAKRRKRRYEMAADAVDLNLSEWVRRILDDAVDDLLGKADHLQDKNSPKNEETLDIATIPITNTGGSHVEKTEAGHYLFVPVVGRTSAGTAAYWNDLNLAASSGIIARIEQRLYELAGIVPQQSCDGGLSHVEKSDISAVSLLQYSTPDEQGIVEFLSVPAQKHYKEAIAWRVDGNSMLPQYHDGDFVIVSPAEPAKDGHPCVAHQKGQLGVNCKIFRQQDDQIFLIPVNENYPTQQFPTNQLEWAFRVLSRVQLNR